MMFRYGPFHANLAINSLFNMLHIWTMAPCLWVLLVLENIERCGIVNGHILWSMVNEQLLYSNLHKLPLTNIDPAKVFNILLHVKIWTHPKMPGFPFIDHILQSLVFCPSFLNSIMHGSSVVSIGLKKIKCSISKLATSFSSQHSGGSK